MIHHVVPTLHKELGGVDVAVRALCAGLRGVGEELAVHTLSAPREGMPGIDVREYARGPLLPPRLGWSPAMKAGLLKAVHGGDVVHNNSLWMMPNIYAGLTAIRKKAILVNAPQGTLTEWSRGRSSGRKRGRLGPDVIHLHGIHNLGAMQAAVGSGRAVLHGHDYRSICPASPFFYKRTKTICTRTCGLSCFGVTALRHCMTPRPRPGAYLYWRLQWIKRNASLIRRVIAPSQAAGDRFVQAGFTEDQVSVNPYFCPLEPRADPRPLPTDPTITFLGRASYKRGWEVLIEPLGRLPTAVRGLMVGNFGPDNGAAIRKLAERKQCADRLAIEGWAGRGEVASVYARTTVSVFLSLWPETMGIVGVEALSQSVPVVASDGGGVREWLRDGENGALVPPGDAPAVATAVTRLLDSPHRLIDSGRAGIRLVQEKFSPKRHVERLMRIYEAA